MAAAADLPPWREGNGALIYRLPEQPWARRISGVLANQLAARAPHQAIGLLSARADGDWAFSLRVPDGAELPADAFCRQFSTGGGRKRAAGINRLAQEDLSAFADRLLVSYPWPAASAR